ncbi:MAG: hypothetical protein OXG36_05325 [Caldilineaceae bacterium]|nr:hypothetical protein [Caldilineaceae bacterium]
MGSPTVTLRADPVPAGAALDPRAAMAAVQVPLDLESVRLKQARGLKAGRRRHQGGSPHATGSQAAQAGFAQGLGIPVIHTCHKDRMNAVPFGTNHCNHLTWKTPEGLRTKLQSRTEVTLGRGPLDPLNDDSGEVDGTLNGDI